MTVDTDHAPVTTSEDVRATDRFAFVRDGFHFWAAILGVVWLAWHRLWLALLGWVFLMAPPDFGMVELGPRGGAGPPRVFPLPRPLGFPPRAPHPPPTSSPH